MNKEDILTNLKITCKQNNININEIFKLYLSQELNDCDIDRLIEEDYETLWDNQPSIEEDENLAFAIQHTKDIYNILRGEF